MAKLRETTPTYWLPSFSSSSTLIACCSKVSSFFSRVEHSSFIEIVAKLLGLKTELTAPLQSTRSHGRPKIEISHLESIAFSGVAG